MNINFRRRRKIVILPGMFCCSARPYYFLIVSYYLSKRSFIIINYIPIITLPFLHLIYIRPIIEFCSKMLYVWNMETEQLIKILDAHFGRIISLLPLTTGNWNSVITSSIDRSVKVWNINNIFEQVHVIDRHELQIDSIRYNNVLNNFILYLINIF